MPQPSTRITQILNAGKNGWELHFAALAKKNAGADVIMMTAGDHDFDTPEGTVEACIAALHAGHHHYTQLPGLDALRKAMAQVSTEASGVETHADDVIVTPGGQGALFAAAQATLNPGDRAMIVSPYYATYPPTFRAAGAHVDTVATRAEDDFQPREKDILAVLTKKTRVLLINSPNNPTGAIYSAETLEMIAEVCRQYDLWLISDEVYWTMGRRTHRSPRALQGMKERTLVINSMSKSHGMTGWRVGWLTGPRDMVAMLTGLNLVTTYGLPDFVSRAAIAALNERIGVDEIARRYAHRRSVMHGVFEQAQKIKLRGSEGAMYIMLDISAIEEDGEAFAWKLLEEEGVAVMPGGSFGPEARSHIRLTLAQPEDRLREGADRLLRFARRWYERKRQGETV